MRTNRRIRDQVRYNIQNFFDEAKERLREPDYDALGLPLVAHYKMDPDIDPWFYEYSWDVASIMVKNNHSFTIKLPEETYGILADENNNHYSWRLQVRVSEEDCPKEILDHWHRREEMENACAAVQKGAREALTETTVEKAIIRFPELKRFLPQ